MKKSSKVILTIVIILLLAVIGVGAFFFVKEKQDNDKKISELEEKINNSKTIENAPSKAIEKDEANNTVNNENKTNTAKKEEPKNQTKTYSDLKGTYKSSSGNSDSAIFLCLNDDGTFAYSVGTDTKSGLCGNYLISDNKIILNNLFAFGSDTSLTQISSNSTMVHQQDTLIINNDGTFTDISTKDGLGERTDADKILKKESSTVDENLTLRHFINVAITDHGMQ